MATTSIGTVTKPKRRNSEKRKEKSRNAARCRRGKETEIFYELAHELPMSHSMCAQLDKAGIMRLILSYLKIKKLIPTVHNIKQEVDEDDDLLSVDQVIDSCYQKALEGFVLILSHEGDIIYLSENVSKYLGLKQTDLMGQSIYDYAHPCDHEEIREQLSSRHLTVPDGGGSNKNCKQKRRHHHNFLIRLKCTLTPRGKKVNLKSAVYKVIQCSGHVQTAPAETIMGYRIPPMPCLVMIASPIHHPANIEIPLDGQTFLTRHSMDMKFTYCDDRIKELLGYESKNLVGRSMHDFYHALDNATIEKCHRDLFAKGQTRTGSYRFLAKEGGYAWVQTEATIIYSNKTNKPQCVVCVNYCLSSIEEDGLILSVDQKPCDTDSGIKLSTENVFAPISTTTSEDAEELKFWLTTDKPCEEGEEEEKENAEKLSCLAPVAGEELGLLDIISRFQGDTQQAEQTADTDEELLEVARMSLKDTGEQPMFVPFDPFAPLSSDNKLATIEELAVEIEEEPSKQDGYYTPPPPTQASLPTDTILTGSNDPLMPDSRPLIKEKRLELGQIAPDDLELRAPYIPMEEDFELGSESGEISTPFNNMADTWVPVDPFGQNTNNVENQFPNLCPSPLRSSTLTLPQLSPLNTPIPSPAAVPPSPATISSPSLSPGGSLSSSLNRSLPNLCSPPMSLPSSSPQPINLPVSSPQPISLPVSSPQQMNYKAVSPPQQPSVPLITQNTLIGARQPSAVPQVGSIVLLSPGTVPTQTISSGKPVLTDRVTGNRPTGLMSMLKRKLSSQQDEAPSCKASKNLAGMKVMRRVDPWPPERCTTAPNDPPLFMRESNLGLTSLLLQPQHQVSGIGDNGSFARFLHKFALNVSNQNPRGGVKEGPGDGSLFIQLNPIQGTEPVKETAERAEMQRRSSLPLIDTQDAEVNAPVQSHSGLLQGEDLLHALDQTINRVPSQVDFRKFQE